MIGFWTYPLAPPRLTPGQGFTDTLHHSSGSSPFGAFTQLANQFAAMPSLHIAWSTWCALVLLTTAPYVWLRALGVVYPCCTLFVVLATANHWVLDAVGGLVCLLIACVLQQAITGRQFPGSLRRPYGESVEAQPRRSATEPHNSPRNMPTDDDINARDTDSTVVASNQAGASLSARKPEATVTAKAVRASVVKAPGILHD